MYKKRTKRSASQLVETIVHSFTAYLTTLVQWCSSRRGDVPPSDTPSHLVLSPALLFDPCWMVVCTRLRSHPASSTKCGRFKHRGQLFRRHQVSATPHRLISVQSTQMQHRLLFNAQGRIPTTFSLSPTRPSAQLFKMYTIASMS